MTLLDRLARSRVDARPAPVQVVSMMGRIFGDAGRGLARCWWILLGLAALGFTAHHLLIDVGAKVAVRNGPAGMALLVLAITVRLVMIAVMVLVAAGHIRVNGRPLVSVDLFRFITDSDQDGSDQDGSDQDSSDPDGSEQDETDRGRPGGDHTGSIASPRLREHLEAFMTALGPLVLLYAGWQLVNADLHQFLVRLFDVSMGSADQVDNSNINFNQGWKSYISWAIGLWVVKIILEQIRHRTGRKILDLPIVYAEVGWIVLAWLVVTSIVGRIRSWWRAREVVHWWRETIDFLTTVAPPDLHLPAVINTIGAALGGFVSLLFFQLVQPLIWIAVVGLVLGWGLSESSLMEGSRWGATAQQRWSGASGRYRFALDNATRGLREKYVPVLAMLRLMWRSGPLPILTIGALYAIGGWAGEWLQAGVESMVDPHGDISGMAAETVERCVRFLLEPLRVCFLVATFAEVLRLRATQVAAGQRVKR